MPGVPLFSILLPTHTRVDVIGHAIRSVLDQTIQDFELIVVGDGAVEGTGAAVEAFGDPRILWLDLPKSPSYGYANRNEGLRRSRGRYIAFIADDDLLFPDHLELMAAALDTGARLACGRALWVSTDGVAAPLLTNLGLADEMAVFMSTNNTFAASCIAYRADTFAQRDVWDETLHQAADWRLWQRIIRENPDNPPVMVTPPSVLHFSARRHNSRHADRPEFLKMLDLADAADWWPAALHRPTPEGVAEQDVWAAAMRADPAAFTREVRAASDIAVTRLARDYSQTVWPMTRRLQDDLAAAQAEIAGLRQALAASEEQLRSMRKSKSWRLTAPLRRLAAAFRKRR